MSTLSVLEKERFIKLSNGLAHVQQVISDILVENRVDRHELIVQIAKLQISVGMMIYNKDMSIEALTQAMEDIIAINALDISNGTIAYAVNCHLTRVK